MPEPRPGTSRTWSAQPQTDTEGGMWGKYVGLRNANLISFFSVKRMKIQHKLITSGLRVLEAAMKVESFPIPLPSQPVHQPAARGVCPAFVFLVPALGRKES